MYGVAGEKRPIFLESDAFLYNLDDPTLGSVSWVRTCNIRVRVVGYVSPAISYIKIRSGAYLIV
jgi:hypothetical protein